MNKISLIHDPDEVTNYSLSLIQAKNNVCKTYRESASIGDSELAQHQVRKLNDQILALEQQFGYKESPVSRFQSR